MSSKKNGRRAYKTEKKDACVKGGGSRRSQLGGQSRKRRVDTTLCRGMKGARGVRGGFKEVVWSEFRPELRQEGENLGNP